MTVIIISITGITVGPGCQLLLGLLLFLDWLLPGLLLFLDWLFPGLLLSLDWLFPDLRTVYNRRPLLNVCKPFLAKCSLRIAPYGL